jgi:hypothetical protein
MLCVLKNRCLSLAGDESGVAFAFAVTVSLIVFLFGAAVYACGETVRERIELQNAADAAAYSGALVQADTLSRIAVINKAMAWNYVMMTRRQMDHVVDNWLSLTLNAYNNAKTVTRAYQNVCACHPRAEFANWRVGVAPGGGGGEVTHQLIRLNESQDVFIPAIEAAHGGHGGYNPVSQLASLRRCIEAMNQAEKELVSGMKKRIENAVEFIVRSDVSLTENDRKAPHNREIEWAFYDLHDASDYLEVLKNDERRFLRFGGGVFDASPSDPQVFNTGADTWLVKGGGEGFQRNYRQSGNTLSARWFTYNQIWVHPDKVCVFAGLVVQPGTTITAEMARDEYYTGQTAKPQVLRSNFFQPDGAITVGVSRPLNNPFAFVFNGSGKAGIFSAFNVGGGGETMWCVASARAGYRLGEELGKSGWNGEAWQKGEYRNRGEIDDKFNLCVADWDAELLPLRENYTAGHGVLGHLAGKLGASSRFAGRNHFEGYSNIAFSQAKSHLYH